ncbi:hypothetical protein D3C76_1765760 [compost metagenome]
MVGMDSDGGCVPARKHRRSGRGTGRIIAEGIIKDNTAFGQTLKRRGFQDVIPVKTKRFRRLLVRLDEK